MYSVLQSMFAMLETRPKFCQYKLYKRDLSDKCDESLLVLWFHHYSLNTNSLSSEFLVKSITHSLFQNDMDFYTHVVTIR